MYQRGPTVERGIFSPLTSICSLSCACVWYQLGSTWRVCLLVAHLCFLLVWFVYWLHGCDFASVYAYFFYYSKYLLDWEQEKKKNTLKDFVHVAGPLGVTHLLIISSTENAPYLRVARCPHGPTLTFKIHEYSLMADIARSQPRPRSTVGIFKNPPLVSSPGDL